ncbi:DNA-processing protein DprA [Nitratireductor kimnyeongensis]|uniref:DNA-processing protein DprA n=1 Tax=Nitratireductor kimnyeongensis TaxID=430679 RepID=A0ABW0T2F4_9HYPH|nr:DNA-processing protein DprA [Nitratireductor kimnyeongensis]QZZ35396.1 DNA-processing protein DprA [Nitratireductor kimnyeongensis]
MSLGEGARLSDRQRLAWLQLLRSENVGPVTFRQLVNHCGSAEAALQMLPELAARGGATRRIVIASLADAERELEQAARLGARFVAVGEPEYPPLMRRMDQPPPLLAMKGDLSVALRPTVALVGARNASLTGMKMARRLAAELGSTGFSVASGLARGIDAAVHQGSLESGTIAALAGGLDRPYPPENLALFDEIAERGTVLSEMPFGWAPRARDFPRRNRLVAGVAFGLVVVEAAKRSGSLISARLAGEMGRLVFAVPGSPLDPRAGGTNALLKDGAILVTEAEDIVSQIIPLLEKPLSKSEKLEEPPTITAAPPPDDRDRDRVTQTLGPSPVLIDDIIRHTGLHPSQVLTVLLELDLAGRLERHSGSAVSLLPGDM